MAVRLAFDVAFPLIWVLHVASVAYDDTRNELYNNSRCLPNSGGVCMWMKYNYIIIL